MPAQDAQLNIDAEHEKAGSGGDREFVYHDGSAKLWSVYLSEAFKNDDGIVENMKGNTDGILVFTGLFSATVAAFIIESYKTLQPDSGDTTVLLLTQISQQLAAAANGTRFPLPSPGPDNAPFHAASSSLRVNILWFISLILSLSCALIATLMQQWARRYLQGVQGPATPHRRGPIHAYLHMGLQTFRMASMIEALPALLHISVFLFFAGLVEFIFQINTTVAWAALAFVIFVAAAYLLLTILPILYLNCPYQTPLSAFFRASIQAVVSSLPTALSLVLDCVPRHSWRRTLNFRIRPLINRWRARFPRSRARGTEIAAKGAKNLTYRAMRWAMNTLEEDMKLEQLVDGISTFLSSPKYKTAGLTVETMLLKDGLGVRLGYLLSTGLLPGYFNAALRDLRTHRLTSCMTTIRSIALSLLSSTTIPWDQVFSFTGAPLYLLCHEEDPDVAVPAACTAAVVSLATLIQLKSDKHRARPAPGPEGIFFLTVPQLIQSSVLHDMLMSLKPTISTDTLGIAYVYRQLSLRRSAMQYPSDAAREKMSDIGYALNVVTLVDRILPHLRTASHNSLALAWSTLAELVWYGSTGEGMGELEDLRTRIQSAADELGVQELAQCVDGELPPGAAVTSPYTKLYDLLRPVFDYQRPRLDPVEPSPHPASGIMQSPFQAAHQLEPHAEKQTTPETPTSASRLPPLPTGPSRGSSKSGKSEIGVLDRALDEEI